MLTTNTMEGLTFLADNFSLEPNGFQGASTEAPKVIQNFIIKQLDGDNIELISCDVQDLQTSVPSESLPDLVLNPLASDMESYIKVSANRNQLPEEASTPSKGEQCEKVLLDITVYSCSKCKEQFTSLALFRQHLKWHKASKSFNCPKCMVGFNVENNLKIHMVTSHPGNLDACPICKISFQRKASLRSHMMIHQVEELFECEDCHGEFQNDDELLKHMETHATTKVTKALTGSLVCHYCKLEFQAVGDYRQHVAKHIEVKKNVLKGKKLRKRKIKEGGYKCRYCSKIFPKVSLVDRHERIHTGEKPYKCQFCSKAFAQKGTLQIHLDKHTGLKPYPCTLCSAKFSQKGNLRAHVDKTHTAPKSGQKLYKCSQCTCIFRKIATLNGHITKVHLNQPEEDSQNIIDKVMNSLRELHSELGKSALKQDESKPNLTTTLTTPGTTTVRLVEGYANGSVRRHTVRQKKIGDVRWYFCNYCSRKFKKPSDLIRHFRTHTLEKPYKCSTCSHTFSLKSTLVNHYKMHERLGCQCENCDNSGKTSRGSEIEEDAAPPNYSCTLCDKVFFTIEEGKDHRTVHGDQLQDNEDIIQPLLKQPLYQTTYGSLELKPPKAKIPNTGAESPLERPHHCKICDARFTRLMSLKRHMLHHTGERKFKCSLCPKAFVTKYRLKEHLNFHKNIKNYGCTTCGKKFVTSSLLKRHAIVHNSVRPYLCPYCDKHFKTVLLCRSHIKNVHKAAAVEAVKEKSLNSAEQLVNDISVQEVQDLPTEIASEISDSHAQPILSTGCEMVCLSIGDLLAINPEGILNEPLKAPNDSYTTFNPLSDLQESPSMLFNIDDGKTDMVNPNDVIKSVAIDSDDTTKPSDGMAEQQQQFTPVNLSGLPINIIDASSANVTSEMIPSDAQVICINCHRMFSDYYVFEKHVCEDNFNLLLQEGTTTDASEKIKAPKSEYYENKTSIASAKPNSKLNLEEMKKFAYKKPLLMDVEKLERSRQFVCKLCNFVTSFDDRFRKHLLLHPGLNERICKFCLKDFKKLSDLKRHVRTHTGEKPFECERCHKKFTLKSTLESHMRTHDMGGFARISCDVCNSNFTSKSSLKVHMLLHTGARPHACTYCDQTFRTSAIRKAHERNIHLAKSDLQSAAGKSKLGGSKLVKSIAEEVAENVRKETTQPVDPKDVADSQAGDPMFFVQQIDNSGIIIAPVPVNLGEIALLDMTDLPSEPKNDFRKEEEAREPNQKQRVECDICHKLYSSKDVLRKHKRTLHGQNRKFPCIKCDKGYDQLEELHKHIAKLHTGSRPYACQYCSNSFSEENSLKTHIKRIHQKSVLGQETANALLVLQYDLSNGSNFL